MDIPCAPILADITVNGRAIKAVAQPTKQGLLYVFDRATGQPVWPIEERPVPKGDVPGEWTSPTQPFPTKPAGIEGEGVIDRTTRSTPHARDEGRRGEAGLRLQARTIFTPPVVSKWPGPLATLMLPSTTGGANWQGGAFDPETKLLYIYSATVISPLGLTRPDAKVSDMNYITGVARDPNAPPPAPPAAPGGQAAGAAAPAPAAEGGPQLSVQGLPLVKPPYGRITAIDMNKGEIVWQIAHGETPDNIRNHPALKGVTIPRTGRPGRIGTLVTKTRHRR